MTGHDDSQPRRKRARLACIACNSRRVKCNVIESRPCDNCIAGNVTCETRESRRGKHPRRPRSATTNDALRSSSLGTLEVPEVDSTTRNQDEVAASHVLASLSGFQNITNTEQYQSEGRLFQDAAPSPFTIPVTQVEEHGSAAPPPRAGRQEDDAAVFLGESTSLRYVAEDPVPAVPSRKRPRLRHSVPNAAKADALIPQWEAERRKARMKSLHVDGAFSFPPGPIRIDLLKAYFRWFHPHFPIVDEPEIWSAHGAGAVSPLLLQAMLFIGVIHCDDTTLKDLGWGTRHRAKYLFYTRAKDIYDAEYETKKLTVIQAVFLMSFWRAGALLEKDVRHWLGVAISLAQTKALHRSGADSEEHERKMRRRLWWAIYVRERQCSSALGLPNRIRDIDCDIEQLSASDFQSAFDPATPGATVDKDTSYMIGIVRLAIFLGRIVDAGYLPNRSLTPSDRLALRAELFGWKQHLPRSMQLATDAAGTPPSFQSSMLHLAYNNLLILLHRSAFITNEESETEAANIALQAAARNARIVEDMLSEGFMSHAQIHVITNLFNTLCIHVAHLRGSSGVNRTIAEHRAKLCLLGLKELQKTWEVTNWVLQLFFQYLDRSTAARLEVEADDVDVLGGAPRDVGASAISIPVPHLTSHVSLGDGGPGVGSTQEAAGAGDPDSIMAPWSWSTDEANQYLFSQIENDFAFGEGGILGWSPDEQLDAVLPDLEYGELEALRPTMP